MVDFKIGDLVWYVSYAGSKYLLELISLDDVNDFRYQIVIDVDNPSNNGVSKDWWSLSMQDLTNNVKVKW